MYGKVEDLKSEVDQVWSNLSLKFLTKTYSSFGARVLKVSLTSSLQHFQYPSAESKGCHISRISNSQTGPCGSAHPAVDRASSHGLAVHHSFRTNIHLSDVTEVTEEPPAELGRVGCQERSCSAGNHNYPMTYKIRACSRITRRMFRS